MSTPASTAPATPHRRVLAALLLAHLLVLAALSVSPAWHHWLHADADNDAHTCAVTLFQRGDTVDAPPPVALPAEPAPATVDTIRADERPVWVASIFVLSRVFEHGPPFAR